jgi:hypothetical protein
MNLQVKETRQTKKTCWHYLIGNFIDEYIILPTRKIICNSIGDLFYITDNEIYQ